MDENIFRPLHMEHSFHAPIGPEQEENAAHGNLLDDFTPNHAPIHIESSEGRLLTTLQQTFPFS
jgi:CubicO group peptidase (beta-lactamase class C family)